MRRSIVVSNGINGVFGQPQSIVIPQLGLIHSLNLTAIAGAMTAAQFVYFRLNLDGEYIVDLTGTFLDESNKVDSIPGFAVNSCMTLPFETPGLLSSAERAATSIPLDGSHQKNMSLEWQGVSAPPAADPTFELTVDYDDKYNPRVDKGKCLRRLTKLDTLIAGSDYNSMTKLVYGNSKNRFIKRIMWYAAAAKIAEVRVEYGKDKLRIFERDQAANAQIIATQGGVVGKVPGTFWQFIIDNGETGRPRYWDTSKFQIGDQNVNLLTYVPTTGGTTTLVEETYGDRPTSSAA